MASSLFVAKGFSNNILALDFIANLKHDKWELGGVDIIIISGSLLIASSIVLKNEIGFFLFFLFLSKYETKNQID